MKLSPSSILATLALFFTTTVTVVCAADPLPSWTDGKTKSDIVHFVEAVTKENSTTFVPQAERIATFDNDGTLWLEQPIYTQARFALDRLKALAPLHPEIAENTTLKAIISGDFSSVTAGGAKGLAELLLKSDAGMSVAESDKLVKEWLATAKDARFKRPYTQLIYQPMLELLAYLRSCGFKTYIVTGGGTDFVRTYSEKCYGIPPEQVIGSSVKTQFEYGDGKPTIVELPELDLLCDKGGKPVAIDKFIGRRPIAAFGNSDGDIQMLQWTDAGPNQHICAFVHHTDAAREYAYDRASKVGKLDKGLDEAGKHGWTLIDMKNDWKTIFPPSAN